MRFLITGGLGFIGSNFILNTLQKYPDSKITNVDACLPGSNIGNLAGLRNQNYSYVRGNITNKRLVDKIVSDSDVIVNFAAESHVDRSITDPRPFIDSNILGAYTILEAVRKYKKNDALSYLDWDLKNQANIPIAGGLYIIHIDAPGVGEKILKWFGVMRPVDLDSY